MRVAGNSLAKGRARQRVVPTPEKLIHQGIIDALRILAAPGVLYWHTPNEGDRDPEYAAWLKRLGMLAGVPDLIFLLPGGEAAFIEIKRPNGGRLNQDQLAFKNAVLALGCKWASVTSITYALQMLKEWGVLKKGARP